VSNNVQQLISIWYRTHKNSTWSQPPTDILKHDTCFLHSFEAHSLAHEQIHPSLWPRWLLRRWQLRAISQLLKGVVEVCVDVFQNALV